MHTTLDESTIAYILSLNKIGFLFTQADLIRNLAKSKSNIQTANLISLRSPFIDPLSVDEIEKANFNIFDSEQLIAEGHTLPGLSFNNNLQFSTNDIAVIMFTSGQLNFSLLLMDLSYFLLHCQYSVLNTDLFHLVISSSKQVRLANRKAFFSVMRV